MLGLHGKLVNKFQRVSMPRYDYTCKNCENIMRDVVKSMSKHKYHKCDKCGKRAVRLYDQQSTHEILNPHTLGSYLETAPTKPKKWFSDQRKNVNNQ